MLLTGYYCDQEGLSDVTDSCNPGYYCPAGQSTHSPGATSCPVAHYCPRGSPAAIPCDSGYYQDETTKWDCKICPQV